MNLSFRQFSDEVRACRLCQGKYFDHDPRPIFLAEPASKVLVVGQAPSRRVHQTGKPWDDVSGENLRRWMGVTPEQFYDPQLFAIIAIGLCYPGTVPRKGDLPPPPICAPTWHPRFREFIQPDITLLIGRYAQAYYLQTREPVSAVVRRWREHLKEGIFPLPHPSPRNRRWIAERPWFERECLPALREVTRTYLP